MAQICAHRAGVPRDYGGWASLRSPPCNELRADTVTLPILNTVCAQMPRIPIPVMRQIKASITEWEAAHPKQSANYRPARIKDSASEFNQLGDPAGRRSGAPREGGFRGGGDAGGDRRDDSRDDRRGDDRRDDRKDGGTSPTRLGLHLTESHSTGPWNISRGAGTDSCCDPFMG